jgi:hypothetical protein
MRTSFILASLAAFMALLMAGNPSPSYAASCDTELRLNYKCTATFDDGGSVDYCVIGGDGAFGDGYFNLIADLTYFALCTCEAKGNPPNVRFGAASKDFFCSEDVTYTVSIGKFTGSKIKGQTYNTSVGVRSVFTCEVVASCP